jgi:hypothetical protein
MARRTNAYAATFYGAAGSWLGSGQIDPVAEGGREAQTGEEC